MFSKSFATSIAACFMAALVSLPCLFAQGIVRKWANLKSTVTAQGEEKEYNKIALDAAGNVFTAGVSDDFRSIDWIVRKLAAGTGVVLWEKRVLIGGNSSNSVAGIAVDDIGNVVVTGYAADPAASDYFTAKFAGSDGSTIWQRRYNGPGNGYDEPYAVALDASGNAIVTGTSVGSGGNQDSYTVKYAAATGATLWERRYNGPSNGGDYGRDVKVDAAGNVLLTGFSSSSNGNDYYTAKYAATTGAILWEQRYNGSANGTDSALSLALDAAGNAFVTGISTSTAGQFDMLTLKYAAANGQKLWEQRLNGVGNSDDGGLNIVADSSGNVIVLGYVQTTRFNTRKERVLVKYSGATGALVWDKRETGVGFYNPQNANRLALDSAGNAMITCDAYDAESRQVFFTGKYAAATGATLWENSYTWETTRQRFQVRHLGFGIAVDSAGNPVATGISTSLTGDTDHFTIKYAGAAGDILWTDRANGRRNRDDGPGAVAVDPSGNVVSAGYAVGTGGDDDIQVWKNDAGTGAELWENRYLRAAPAGDDDRAVAVATDSKGDVFVAAVSDQANLNPEIYLAKHAAGDGTPLWQVRKLPEGAYYAQPVALVVDAVGNSIVTGEAWRSASDMDFYTAKYSPGGVLIWEQFYNSPFDRADYAKAIALDSDGNVIVTGSVSSDFSDRMEIRTIKYAAATGAKLWESAYNRPGVSSDNAVAIATDAQGNVAVTGWSSVSGKSDIVTAKYAGATGAVLWERVYIAPSKTARGSGVRADRDGNVVITGYQRSTRNTSDDDAYTAKYAASDGSLLWERIYNGPYGGDDSGQGVVIDSENQVWITATTQTGLQDYGLYTARYSGATGAVLGSDFYDSRIAEANLVKLGQNAIAIGAGDKIAVTGLARPTGKDNDVVTILLEPLQPRLVLERPTGTPIPADAGVDLGLVLAQPPATTATFTVRNTGTATLNLGGISVSGGDPGAFNVVPPRSNSIPSNGTITFEVRLISPTVGPHATTLRLLSNDPSANPLLVPLTYTIASRNADLASLEVDEGTLLPPFSPVDLTYRQTIPFGTSQIRIRPTAEDADATVKVNGDSALTPVPIPVGNTTIAIKVTAQDPRITKTYTIAVTRLPENFTFDSATSVPVSSDGFSGGGYPANFVLNYPPVPGSVLTVVNNTDLAFIGGTFGNLAQGQHVPLTFAGVIYDFVANYFGGTGNDLVLQWAATSVFAWGSNTYGQLGDTSTTDRLAPVATDKSGVLADKTVVATGGGYLHSLALCSDGTLASWGYNIYGQLGNGGSAASPIPVEVDRSGALAGKTVIAISAGPFHNLALCSDGSIAAWGYNNYGQLGTGDKTTRRTPALVVPAGALTGKQVVGIAAGAYHSFARCADGSVVGWGYNDEGELGDNSTTTRLVPVAVDASGPLAGKKVATISTGQYHTLALCTDGTLLAWGYNRHGELGNNTVTSSKTPVAINSFGVLADKTVSAISAGGSHTLALYTDGTLAAWGNNAKLQLGTTNACQSMIPIAVNPAGAYSGKTIVQIVASGDHNMTLYSDGSLAAWGDNSSGQLGNNSTIISEIPSTVDSSSMVPGSQFMVVANGSASHHSLGIVGVPTSGSNPPMIRPLFDEILYQPLLGDPDHDGIPNLIELAFALDPTKDNSGELPLPRRIGDNYVIEFTAPSSLTGITYGAEFSVSLKPGSWRDIPDTGSGFHHIFSVPAEDAKSMFFRLKVSK